MNFDPKHSVVCCWCSLVPKPLPPKERPGTHCLCMGVNIPSFKGIRKTAYTYCTLVTYTNRACSFHTNKGVRVAAAPGYSLLAKQAVSCAISVVKGWSCSRWSRYKPCTKRDKCFCAYSCGYQRSFSVNWFVTFLRLEKLTLWHLKSIPAGFCKLNHC